MAVPDFDTSRNRECVICNRTGFDEGDWQFMGYDDEEELYICPDCQRNAMADYETLQTRDAAEHCVERTEPGLTVTEDATSETCPSCSGYGNYLVGDFRETCPECEGSGHV